MRNSILYRSSTGLQALALLGAGLTSTMVVSAPVAAQDYTNGAIVGSVVDENGTPITSGTATIRSNEQGFARTATVSADGTFRSVQLPIGTYTVEVSSDGRQSVSVPNVVVRAGASNTYVFTLNPAGSAEGGEIVVRASAVRRNDFTANTTGLNIDVEQLVQSVPVARDLTSLILLAPGTQQGDNGFGNFASIGGATVAENAYYVNGLNITDFRDFISPSTLPFEFYRTLDVKTGGLSAEFGRALGGVTSAVTKSGSNTLQGGAVVAWSPRGLYERSPDTYLSRNSDDERESIDANFYLSGPLIKDRLFFYALYSPQYERRGDTSFTGTSRIISRSSSPFFGAKVDAIITDGHRLEGTYFRDRQVFYNDYVAFDPDRQQFGAVAGTARQQFGGDNFIGTYTGRFTDWLTLSAAYGQNNKRTIINTTGGVPLIQSLLIRDTTTGLFSARRARGTIGGASNLNDKREFYRADADIYFNLFGSHHIRGGFDREDLTGNGSVTYAGDGYIYQFRPTYIRRRYYDNTGGFKTRYSAYYLQDSWSLFNERLNLQLGIRNDRFENRNKAGTTFYKSGDQWGPRLGASFDVFGDKRTKISGFWGRYYLPIATNTNARLAGDELYYEQRFNYVAGVNPSVYDAFGVPQGQMFNGNGSPVLGTQRTILQPCPTRAVQPLAGCTATFGDGTLKDTDQLVSSTLKPSYADEWIIGISQTFGDFNVGLRYINRRLGNTLDDVAIDQAVLKYCARNGIAQCDRSDLWGSGYHQYVLANPGQDITVRLDGDCTIARQCEVATLTAADLGYVKPARNYDAVELTFDKPFRNGWTLGGSYIFTRLRGNYEGGVISNINQTDTGLTQDYDQPGFSVGAYGDLANGRKHTIKLFGAVEPIKSLQIGANLFVASPRKFSCLGNFDTDKNPFTDNSFEYGYGAFSYYCANGKTVTTPVYTGPGADGTTRVPQLVPRGTAFQSDWEKQLDLSVQFNIVDLPGSAIRMDVFNVFNWKQKLDFNEFGDLDFLGANPNYQKVTAYQAPRSFRFTFSMRFGQGTREN